MTKSKLPLVVVLWDDAWVQAEGTVAQPQAAREHQPMGMTTIGWLLVDDERGIQVANEFYEHEDSYRGRTFVPRAMVKSVTTFRLVKPSQKREKKLPA